MHEADTPVAPPLSPAAERLAILSRRISNAFLAAAGVVLSTWAILLGSVLRDAGGSFVGTPETAFSDYAMLILNFGTAYLWTATALAGLGAGFRVYAEAQYLRQERHEELLDAIEGRGVTAAGDPGS